MSGARTKLTAAIVAAGLVFTSTAAGAARAAAPAPQAPPTSWTTLSMLTPSGAIGLGGAAAQAAVADNQAPPPPAYAGGGSSFPPIPVIAILLAEVAVAIYILSHHDHGHISLGNPNSPA